jgi:hypothetical protein
MLCPSAISSFGPTGDMPGSSLSVQPKVGAAALNHSL